MINAMDEDVACLAIVATARAVRPVGPEAFAVPPGLLGRYFGQASQRPPLTSNIAPVT